MSTISASTTSTTAYKVTADTTGTLVLQTGSSPTTAVTIDTSQNVTAAGTLQVGTTGVKLSGYDVIGGGTSNYLSLYSNSGGPYIVIRGASGGSQGIEFGTGGAERMRINSSGQITTPYQPCLVAIVTSNKTVSSSASLQFDSISLNRNSAITVSVSNSRFTVPVTGYYVFAMSAFMSSNNDSAMDVRVNGVTNSYRFGSNITGVTGTASNLGTCVSVPLSLSAGDYIEVFGPGGAKTVLGSSPTHSQMSLTLIG